MIRPISLYLASVAALGLCLSTQASGASPYGSSSHHTAHKRPHANTAYSSAKHGNGGHAAGSAKAAKPTAPEETDPQQGKRKHKKSEDPLDEAASQAVTADPSAPGNQSREERNAAKELQSAHKNPKGKNHRAEDAASP